MKDRIIFIYGEDVYSIKNVTRKLVANFIEKEKSDLNIKIFESNDLTLEAFINSIMSAPFLGEEKLTVIKNFLINGDNKEMEKKILKYLEQIPEKSKVIFVEEGKPDARGALFKFLEKINSKNFPPPNEIKIRQFITDLVTQSDLKITNQALSKVSQYVGPDLWQLENELLKLILYVKSINQTEITEENVEKLIEPNITLKIFDLTDALASRNGKKVIGIFNDFVRAGEDLFLVFNMIIYQVRNMLIVEDLINLGKKNDIAKLSGLHPFVVKKIEYSLSKFQKGELVSFYARLGDIDWQIKTGRSEIETALVMLFVDFCKSDKIR
jgi:DNA polymerase-3 subunit delta